MRAIQRRLRGAALGCVLLLSTCLVPAYSCHPDKIDWPQTALDCGPVIDDVVSTVSTILQSAEVPGDEATQTAIGPTASAKLDQLAREHGASVISCLVDLLKSEWTRPGVSSSPERLASAARAQSFLDARGVHVRSNKAYEP